jgi:hypothetical protein
MMLKVAALRHDKARNWGAGIWWVCGSDWEQNECAFGIPQKFYRYNTG